MVVKKKEEGKVIISEEEVKKLVSDQIESISSDANIVQQKAEIVVDQIVAVESLQTTSTTEVATSGLSMLENTVSTKSLVEGTSKTVADNIQQTEKSLTEAKTLVENNHLLEAIQKVKEVTQVNQEIAQAVKETQKAVIEVQSQINQQNLIVNTTTNIGSTIPVSTTTNIGSTTLVITTIKIEEKN